MSLRSDASGASDGPTNSHTSSGNNADIPRDGLQPQMHDPEGQRSFGPTTPAISVLSPPYRYPMITTPLGLEVPFSATASSSTGSFIPVPNDMASNSVDVSYLVRTEIKSACKNKEDYGMLLLEICRHPL